MIRTTGPGAPQLLLARDLFMPGSRTGSLPQVRRQAGGSPSGIAPGGGFILLFELLVLSRAWEMSVATVAELTAEHANR
jgi:hypothetical protein